MIELSCEYFTRAPKILSMMTCRVFCRKLKIKFLIPFGDWNGYIDHLEDGFEGVHGRCVVVKEMVKVRGCLNLQILMIL